MGRTQPPNSLWINDRDYRWPQRPLVVVCLDGSSFDYIEAASAAGLTPYLTSLISHRNFRIVNAVMPTFTNPNNLSIVTGVSPARHGISGNFYLDRISMRAMMMNEPSLLRGQTILSSFSCAGAKVAIITAKDKLRKLLGFGVDGICFSAEQEGKPVYSAALSEHVLKIGLEILKSNRQDLMYLSTSDYIQHLHPPGSDEANHFYQTIDAYLSSFDREGAALVITADHGMNPKTDATGRPQIVFLQTILDESFVENSTTVILPITDPYIAHHGSLGSFASVYLRDFVTTAEIVSRLRAIQGTDLVLERGDASHQLELPADRIGDVIVCADQCTVIGTREADHDLSMLTHPLRSHGGLAEREVPLLFNRPLLPDQAHYTFRNFDAFWIGLNALSV